MTYKKKQHEEIITWPTLRNWKSMIIDETVQANMTKNMKYYTRK